MRVTAHVLCKLDDHRYVMDQMDESEAIADLVKTYNQMVSSNVENVDPNEHLYIIGPVTYGSDFKQWVDMLPDPAKLRLLDRYLSHFPHYTEGDAKTERSAVIPQPSRETDEEKDKRNLRHFFIKLGMLLMFLIALLIIAAAIALMNTKHMLPDNVVVKTVFETATEMAKILFTFK